MFYRTACSIRALARPLWFCFFLSIGWFHTAIASTQDGSCPSQVLDDHVIHIQTPADVERVRSNLIDYIWGQSMLPTGHAQLTVTPNAISPFNCDVNLARVDKINVAMGPAQNGTTINGWAWHFTPLNRNNRLVIVHDGHMDCSTFTDDESGLSTSSLGLQMTVNALLQDGYDVLFALMPFYVPDQCFPGQHGVLFQPDFAPAVGTGARYFLDTTLQSLNYLTSTNTFNEISMLGLSGGGWTTTMYSAIDPRIARSFPVAGSFPLYLRGTVMSLAMADASFLGVPAAAGSCANLGDEEQIHTDLYSIAGYPDLYVLGSYGAGREQVQIINRQDTCCFGQGEEADPAAYDEDIRTYESNVRNSLSLLHMGDFRLEVDEASTHHQISRNALHGLIMAGLNGSRSTVGAASPAQAFIRGGNGNLWRRNSSGWQDIGFRIAGSPSVLENSTFPLQVAARTPANEAELIYGDGSQLQNLVLPSSGLPHSTYGLGKIIGDPVIAAADPGEFDVVAQGIDFAFYRWHIVANIGPAFDQVGGSTYSVGVPSVSRSDSGAPSLSYRSGEVTDPQSSCIEQPRVLYSVSRNGNSWQPEKRVGGVLGVLGVTPTYPSAIEYSNAKRTYFLDQTGAIWENASDDNGPAQWTMLSYDDTPQLAGSPSRVIADAGAIGFYVRASSGDVMQFVYNGTWSSLGLGLQVGDPARAIDSPVNTQGGVYWTGADRKIRFYDGSTTSTLNSVNTIFREDFEGVLTP
jgi:hypothetical protein